MNKDSFSSEWNTITCRNVKGSSIQLQSLCSVDQLVCDCWWSWWLIELTGCCNSMPVMQFREMQSHLVFECAVESHVGLDNPHVWAVTCKAKCRATFFSCKVWVSSLCLCIFVVQVFEYVESLLDDTLCVTWLTDKARFKPVKDKQMDASTGTADPSAATSNKDMECYRGVSSHVKNV